jgi:hypothetical protein
VGTRVLDDGALGAIGVESIDVLAEVLASVRLEPTFVPLGTIALSARDGLEEIFGDVCIVRALVTALAFEVVAHDLGVAVVSIDAFVSNRSGVGKTATLLKEDDVVE